jgi:hypothetical protein
MSLPRTVPDVIKSHLTLAFECLKRKGGRKTAETGVRKPVCDHFFANGKSDLTLVPCWFRVTLVPWRNNELSNLVGGPLSKLPQDARPRPHLDGHNPREPRPRQGRDLVEAHERCRPQGIFDPPPERGRVEAPEGRRPEGGADSARGTSRHGRDVASHRRNQTLALRNDVVLRPRSEEAPSPEIAGRSRLLQVDGPDLFGCGHKAAVGKRSRDSKNGEPRFRPPQRGDAEGWCGTSTAPYVVTILTF